MKIIDRGGGIPIVVVPGIQGRWEWLEPAIDALASRCRVVTFSLADEPMSGGRFNETDGFWSYLDQVREAMDSTGVGTAAVCGVSYGGLIAAAFAARHPERVSSLILVSALPPSWKPDRRVRFYLRAPRLLLPLFMLASLRIFPEMSAANKGFRRGLHAAVSHGWRVITHMLSPSRMARRVNMLARVDLLASLRILHVPTLVLTGEPSLDRVVPVGATLEYLRIWPHARAATIARTGHLGLITRPDDFARAVVPFAEAAARDGDGRRRVG